MAVARVHQGLKQALIGLKRGGREGEEWREREREREKIKGEKGMAEVKKEDCEI